MVKKDIINWLDTRVFYPISDNKWVFHLHCEPKESRVIMVLNQKNELVPMRLVTIWRVSLDYRKLNTWT